ncbi:type II methionyl aminopeptidase [Candidatus Woesearchaeota archaeon]|nr:type II methionyl aminopeptidase [Candidatus Woesearchaeota archaeon]
MNPEVEKKYIEAGKIARLARDFGYKRIKVGASLLEVCEEIERKIRDLGGMPAFPTQISVDHIAAHFCPDPDDLTIFQDEQVVSLDVGVRVDGYVADTAVTKDLGDNDKLIEASKNALEAALHLATPGRKISEIGRAIQMEITNLGFNPIKNLSGHGVGRWIIHGPPQIPNYETGKGELEEDMIIAIEPFASAGIGMIHETDTASIFSLINKKPVRSPITREVLSRIQTYKGLPFATRWLAQDFEHFKVKFAIRDLLKHNIIKAFPPLPDKEGLVSQAEHTVIVKDEPIVTTR